MLKVLKYPHPALIKSCDLVNSFDESLKLLVDNMFITMKANQGIGLAANQVGVNKRLFIMEINHNQFIFINPIILSTNKDIINFNEGCLSFPEFNQETSRFQELHLKWQDLNGNFHENTFTDILAICIQHEIDHLNGKTFLDFLSPLKKQFALKKYLKIQKT